MDSRPNLQKVEGMTLPHTQVSKLSGFKQTTLGGEVEVDLQFCIRKPHKITEVDKFLSYLYNTPWTVFSG